MKDLIVKAVLNGWLFDNVTNQKRQDGTYAVTASPLNVCQLVAANGSGVSIATLKRIFAHYHARVNKLNEQADQALATLLGEDKSGANSKLKEQFELIKEILVYRDSRYKIEVLQRKVDATKDQLKAAQTPKQRRESLKGELEDSQKELEAMLAQLK